MILRDPEVCPNGHQRKSSNIINSRTSRGVTSYRRRRHRCNLCGARWTSYQSLINPRLIKVTYKQIVRSKTSA